MHTGRHVVGTLTAEDSQRLRDVLRAQQPKEVQLDAAAWGASPEAGSITVGIPDWAEVHVSPG